MPWIIFAITAPALFSVSTFFDKFLIEKRIKDPILLTIFGGIIVFFVGLIIFIARGFVIFDGWQIFILLLSGIFGEIALVPYYKALSLEDASRISPLFQIIPVFVLILSYFFIGEFLTREQLLGFFFILLGSFIISSKRVDAGFFRIRKAFWWVLLASFLWALPSVMFKFVAVNQGFWDAIIYEFFGVTIGAVLLFFFYRKRFLVQFKETKAGTWFILNINEAIYFLGRMCIFYAVFLGPVSLVSALGGLNPFFVLIFGFILSIWLPNIVKEDITRTTIFSKAIAIIFMICGLWFINL